MGRDMEPAGFGTDQGVFVGLGRRQGAGGIQLDQFIFEHAFNIWVGADIPQRSGASPATDNTRSIRTTLVAQRPTASGRAARVITARSDAKPTRTGLDPALQ
jgi:hypothetical protein